MEGLNLWIVMSLWVYAKMVKGIKLVWGCIKPETIRAYEFILILKVQFYKYLSNLLVDLQQILTFHEYQPTHYFKQRIASSEFMSNAYIRFWLYMHIWQCYDELQAYIKWVEDVLKGFMKIAEQEIKEFYYKSAAWLRWIMPQMVNF